MSRESGRKWDGRSRVTTEWYKKRYDEIFKKKTKELNDKRETDKTDTR
jgi:hypothetical protein